MEQHPSSTLGPSMLSRSPLLAEDDTDSSSDDGYDADDASSFGSASPASISDLDPYDNYGVDLSFLKSTLQLDEELAAPARQSVSHVEELKGNYPTAFNALALPQPAKRHIDWSYSPEDKFAALGRPVKRVRFAATPILHYPKDFTPSPLPKQRAVFKVTNSSTLPATQDDPNFVNACLILDYSKGTHFLVRPTFISPRSSSSHLEKSGMARYGVSKL
jgi:hypothetical protein